ncbi:Gibberellin-regulated protein 3 [Linum grandiflorum]
MYSVPVFIYIISSVFSKEMAAYYLNRSLLWILISTACVFLTFQIQIHAAHFNQVNQIGGSVDCEGKCEYRCSKASRHKMCIRACNTCCHRCNCVPPGTYGNYDTCPCYANMTTHGGRPKCP